MVPIAMEMIEAVTTGRKFGSRNPRRHRRDFGDLHGLPGTFAGPARFTFTVRTLNLEQEGFGRIVDRAGKKIGGPGL